MLKPNLSSESVPQLVEVTTGETAQLSKESRAIRTLQGLLNLINQKRQLTARLIDAKTSRDTNMTRASEFKVRNLI